MSSESWAQVSNALVYSTIIVLAVALVAFAADLAFGVGRKRALAAKQRQTSLARQSAGASGGVTTAVAAPETPADERWARVGVSLTTLAAVLAAAGPPALREVHALIALAALAGLALARWRRA